MKKSSASTVMDVDTISFQDRMRINDHTCDSWLVQIDGFYENPEAVREYALSLAYEEGRPHFPGMRTKTKILTSQIRSKLEALLRREVDWEKCSPHNGVFQYSLDSDIDTYIHADYLSDWAGVVYLSDMDAEGTRFYRHKVSGFNRLPSMNEAFARGSKLGVPHLQLVDMLNTDKGDESKWEVTLGTRHKFNRLVLYPAFQFHRNATSWGRSIHDGRLVQVFFLRCR